MKTSLLFLFAFTLLATASLKAQQKTIFENAGITKGADGNPCMHLAWKKGSENTDYYIVERSNDGKSFKQIALVFTSEDPAFSDYKFRDKGYPTAGNALYYRVTLVNDRKELTYLPVRRVELSMSQGDSTNLEESK